MYLYHYRSIDSAIKELSGNTFKFSSVEELNDPLESYVRLYWKGDIPAWEGLFRNYICSLYQAICFYLLRWNKEDIKIQVVLKDIHAFDNVQLGQLLHNIGSQFLDKKVIQWLISFYGKNNLKCGTKELILIFRSMHELAFKMCIENMITNCLITEEQGEMILKTIKVNPEDGIGILMAASKSSSKDPLLNIDESIRRKLFGEIAENVQDIIEQQLFLLDAKQSKEKNTYVIPETIKQTELLDADIVQDFLYKNGKEDGNRERNWLEIRHNFPKIYIEQLKNLIFPEVYVVCFSGKKDDSSMWGYYADNHKGVCLIYDSDELMIEPKRENSSESPNYIKADIKQIKYGGDLVERNFFETLGKLSKIQIKDWLTGRTEISRYYDLYTSKDNKWREEYWKVADIKDFQKLLSWSHEDEYRIRVENILGRYDNAEDRILKYNTRALKGIIFGIKTSEYDMKRVIEALPLDRDLKDDIVLYQADYNDELLKIEIRKKYVIICRNKNGDIQKE